MGDHAAAEVFNVCFPRKSSLPLEEVSVVAPGIDPGAETSLLFKRAAVDAAGVFRKHGFVVVKQLLKPRPTKLVLDACNGFFEQVQRVDRKQEGNRNPGRYSFGSLTPSGQCMHISGFMPLLDQPFIYAVMDEIYGTPKANGLSNYVVAAAGGDFCTGETWEFQKLHSDMRPAQPLKGKGKGKMAAAPIHDKDIPPLVSVNYIVQDLTPCNGPMRIVSWSEMQSYCEMERNLSAPAPELEREYVARKSWLSSKIFPLKAGDCLIRDIRVWHGGCPNLSGEARFLPGIELTSRAYIQHLQTTQPTSKKLRTCLPDQLFHKLGDTPRKHCSHLVEKDPRSEVKLHVDDFTWLKRDLVAAARDNYNLERIYAKMRDGYHDVIVQGFHQLYCCASRTTPPEKAAAAVLALQKQLPAALAEEIALLHKRLMDGVATVEHVDALFNQFIDGKAGSSCHSQESQGSTFTAATSKARPTPQPPALTVLHGGAEAQTKPQRSSAAVPHRGAEVKRSPQELGPPMTLEPRLQIMPVQQAGTEDLEPDWKKRRAGAAFNYELAPRVVHSGGSDETPPSLEVPHFEGTLGQERRQKRWQKNL